jgi:hypothetical protein
MVLEECWLGSDLSRDLAWKDASSFEQLHLLMKLGGTEKYVLVVVEAMALVLVVKMLLVIRARC